MLSQHEQDKRDRLKNNKPRVFEKVCQYQSRIEKGESIAIIVFQYDFRCNFKCEHCSIELLKQPGKRAFTLADVREFSRQADEWGLAHFTISGGEPLTFPDLDQLIEAIDPSKFYIALDTNGWLLDTAKAKHLKGLGVDKIDLSFDSLSAAEHDAFRRKPGSHDRALRAIDAAKEAGLNIILQTVIAKRQVRTPEFIDLLEFAKTKDVGVCVIYAKPVGSWLGNSEILVDRSDIEFVAELEKKYNVFNHLTPCYGMDLGCISVKRIIAVTQHGDVMPCPYIHTSIGNFFEEPLRDILARGVRIKYFGKHVDTCLNTTDHEFNDKINPKLCGRQLPVPHHEVFDQDDYF